MPSSTLFLRPTPTTINTTTTTISLVVLLILWWITVTEASITAMYVFGDSTFDVGNNNYIFAGNMTNKANYRPNGIDFPDSRPTGRFSNGYLGIDFLAQKLGFQSSPPAALSVLSPFQVFQGLNFASGGSGILDATGQGLSISMNQQINRFQSVANTVIVSRGISDGGLFLSRSLFVFSTGNNDMFDHYLSTGARVRTANDAFVGSLTDQFTAQIRRVYSMGARKFVVFGIGLVGCIPAFRSFSLSGDCAPELNAMARKFNEDVKDVLLDLKSSLQGMEYSFVDTHDISSFVLRNAAQFGFKELKVACCGGMESFNGRSSACGPNTAYCLNRDEYLSWDHAHPTQANYKLIINLVFNDTQMFTNPMNIEELARI